MADLNDPIGVLQRLVSAERSESELLRFEIPEFALVALRPRRGYHHEVGAPSAGIGDEVVDLVQQVGAGVYRRNLVQPVQHQ